MRNLGLIGGLGPGSTVHYYRELAKTRVGGMMIIHADIGRVLDDAQRGDRVGLAAYLACQTDSYSGHPAKAAMTRAGDSRVWLAGSSVAGQ
jgi:hypothetical protein